MTYKSAVCAASAVAAAFLFTASAALGADAVAGEAVFKLKCATCHTADKGGKNGVGPNLFGVAGQKSGQVASFTKYSPAFKAASMTWTDDKLKAWITGPNKLVPGTKMILIKPVTDAEADNIIAYLNTKK